MWDIKWGGVVVLGCEDVGRRKERKARTELNASSNNPRVATPTDYYMGLVQKFQEGMDYVHVIVHII